MINNIMLKDIIYNKKGLARNTSIPTLLKLIPYLNRYIGLWKFILHPYKISLSLFFIDN